MILKLLEIFNRTKILRELKNSSTLSGKACLLENKKNYPRYTSISESFVDRFL